MDYETEKLIYEHECLGLSLKSDFRGIIEAGGPKKEFTQDLLKAKFIKHDKRKHKVFKLLIEKMVK